MYKKLTAESRGGHPLPLGARELHAVTVHFFSRQNLIILLVKFQNFKYNGVEDSEQLYDSVDAQKLSNKQ